ncbi:uncharacterized protein LOC115726123 [Rhodamnia argentea]|uniref:Uncharacterized protein LOC115726123 n=1 Tax=Rhodamnia argentea TaxID=178133 RepID=A0ABM3HH03_9MYRT|nr:uncharacterized protein LOC115726123 [Rhodamnia argentea]
MSFFQLKEYSGLGTMWCSVGFHSTEADNVKPAGSGCASCNEDKRNDVSNNCSRYRRALRIGGCHVSTNKWQDFVDATSRYVRLRMRISWYSVTKNRKSLASGEPLWHLLLNVMVLDCDLKLTLRF